MPSDAINDARRLIQARLAELEVEVERLERALKSLGESTSSRAVRPRIAAGIKRQRKGERAKRGQRRKQLLAAIKANPGARPSDVAREIGISANHVHSLIAKARKDKLLIRKGKGYALKK